MVKKLPKPKYPYITLWGEIKQPNITLYEIDIDYAKEYYCPFCLRLDKIGKFIYMLRSGRISRKVECPECHVVFYLSTLRQKMTVEQYAKWIAEYPASEFWRKCSFQKWRLRLKEIDPLNRFWDYYRKYKNMQIRIPR